MGHVNIVSLYYLHDTPLSVFETQYIKVKSPLISTLINFYLHLPFHVNFTNVLHWMCLAQLLTDECIYNVLYEY